MQSGSFDALVVTSTAEAGATPEPESFAMVGLDAVVFDSDCPCFGTMITLEYKTTSLNFATSLGWPVTLSLTRQSTAK